MTTKAIADSKNSNINAATGKPKKNSMWRGDKQRPAAAFSKKEESNKKKSDKDPYEKLPESATLYELIVRGTSVGFSFIRKEVISWYRDSKVAPSEKVIREISYTKPVSLSRG